MKVAAIYARKSTGQHVASDAKSVTRQVENARAFAVQQGWTVDDRFVFIDDGVSGAEFERRPGFVSLMDALRPKPSFQVLIISEESRLGRSTTEVPYAIGRLVKAGVEVWCYRDQRKVALDTPMDKFMVSATSFASDMERWLGQQRTIEAMLRKARAGHVTGGRCFGYDNVRLDDHVERRVNATQAAVVKDICTRYADGEGFKQIAHALNAKKLPSPRPQRGRPAGWDQSSIRAVLKRSSYRGTITYNCTTKRRPDGSRHTGRQPTKDKSQWVIVDAPQLRLVEADLAAQVDERLAERRDAYLRDGKGRLLGSPKRHGHGPVKRLLAGFIVCECGATFEAVKGRYVCSARRRKGPTVCPQKTTFDVNTVDHIFLDTLEAEVLSPTFIDTMVDAAYDAAANAGAERQAGLDEQQRLTREIENLTRGIAAGGEIPALATALQERDRRLKVVTAELAKPTTAPDRETLKAALELRTADWREILRGPHVAQARLVLQHLLDLPIRVINQPMPKWMVAVKPGGLAVGIQSVASPRGFEPVSQPRSRVADPLTTAARRWPAR